MKIVYLLLSNFEYIGLLLMMLSLISDVKITRNIRKWIGVSAFMGVVVVGSAYIYNVNIIFFLFLMLLVVVIGVCVENFKWGMSIDVVLSVVLISISTQLLKMIVFVALAWGGITISDDWASVVAQLVAVDCDSTISTYTSTTSSGAEEHSDEISCHFYGCISSGLYQPYILGRIYLRKSAEQ